MLKKVGTILGCFLIAQAAAATPQASGRGQITFYGTGWGSNSVRVQISNTNYSQGNCSAQDGYQTMDSDFGADAFKTHTAALLAAYMAKKNVQVMVDGCTPLGRPRIIGVDISD